MVALITYRERPIGRILSLSVDLRSTLSLNRYYADKPILRTRLYNLGLTFNHVPLQLLEPTSMLIL